MMRLTYWHLSDMFIHAGPLIYSLEPGKNDNEGLINSLSAEFPRWNFSR